MKPHLYDSPDPFTEGSDLWIEFDKDPAAVASELRQVANWLDTQGRRVLEEQDGK